MRTKFKNKKELLLESQNRDEEILLKDYKELVDSNSIIASTLYTDDRPSGISLKVSNEPQPKPDLDWNSLGWEDSCPGSILAGYAYAKYLQTDLWPNTLAPVCEELQRYSYVFSGNRDLIYMPVLEFNSNITKADYMFKDCMSLTDVASLDLRGVSDASGLFEGCVSLMYIDELNLATQTATYNMFKNCSCLITAPSFDTAQAVECEQMFYGCYSLERVPYYDFSQAIDVSSMFEDCRVLIHIPAFNMPNAMYVENLFKNCLSLDSESLNNVLLTAISMTQFSGEKTLEYLGVTEYLVDAIMSLPAYQDFIDAGWTIN